jgi:oxygen-dependent protoporphyrinogen oxidase
VHRYALGIPQYNLGHEARVVRTDACRRGFPGLFLAGNAYRGVGVNDCVREGGRVAREVLAWLESA